MKTAFQQLKSIVEAPKGVSSVYVGRIEDAYRRVLLPTVEDWLRGKGLIDDLVKAFGLEDPGEAVGEFVGYLGASGIKLGGKTVTAEEVIKNVVPELRKTLGVRYGKWVKELALGGYVDLADVLEES